MKIYTAERMKRENLQALEDFKESCASAIESAIKVLQAAAQGDREAELYPLMNLESWVADTQRLSAKNVGETMMCSIHVQQLISVIKSYRSWRDSVGGSEEMLAHDLSRAIAATLRASQKICNSAGIAHLLKDQASGVRRAQESLSALSSSTGDPESSAAITGILQAVADVIESGDSNKEGGEVGDILKLSGPSDDVKEAERAWRKATEPRPQRIKFCERVIRKNHPDASSGEHEKLSKNLKRNWNYWLKKARDK